jgi:16S rRNA (guanine527-N7)-methyltransferase
MSPRRDPRDRPPRAEREDRNPQGSNAIPRTISRGERSVLAQLAQAHALDGDAGRAEAALGTFLEEILSWTRDSNLVAQADLGRLASRHVAESLEALAAIDARAPKTLIDIGSGGGFPGIPIAILRPKIEVTLVESRRRKGLFLQRVIQTLGLENAHAVTDRAERVELPAAERVDFATARAVAVLRELLPLLAPLVRPGGTALLFKGSSHEAELLEWRQSGDKRWEHRSSRAVPDRHLYLLEFERTAAE